MKNQIRTIILCAGCLIIGITMGCAKSIDTAKAEPAVGGFGDYYGSRVGHLDNDQGVIKVEVYMDKTNHVLIYKTDSGVTAIGTPGYR